MKHTYSQRKKPTMVTGKSRSMTKRRTKWLFPHTMNVQIVVKVVPSNYCNDHVPAHCGHYTVSSQMAARIQVLGQCHHLLMVSGRRRGSHTDCTRAISRDNVSMEQKKGFFENLIEYLGHVIQPGRHDMSTIAPDAISWLLPLTACLDLRSFLSFAILSKFCT